MLAIALSFIAYHSYKINSFDKDVDKSYNIIINAYENDDFETISAELETLKKAWDDAQLHAGITIETSQLEEIEISLLQCIRYSQLADKEDFIGEFVLFNELIKHLPYYERITVESLL